MNQVADTLAGLTALALWVFAVDYARLRPWRNPGGRIVLTVSLAFAVVMTLLVARLCFGDFVFHEAVRVLAYATGLVAVLSVWVAFRRAQSRARRARKERDRDRS